MGQANSRYQEQANQLTSRITRLSTILLMLAVICFLIRNLYSYGLDINGNIVAIILGDPALATKNILSLPALGSLFVTIDILLMALIRLFAGLSFAAVCFDESKDIWFRAVSVCALMLILYGGINII